MPDVDETFKRLKQHKGVLGVLVVNKDGVPLRSTFEEKESLNYSLEITPLCLKAAAATKNLDAEDQLQFLRLRTKKYEIMVAPDAEYFLIVIQNPSSE